ncbi:MAG TPA: tail fiber protein [Rhizomicrobium sp.]|jgi:microcystin-dependent protein
MSTPFLSEIRIMSFNFAPKGWTMCNGQLLPINQNQALFSLLGTTYGGDGRVNFGLPNLQARIPIHMGGGHTLGELGGENAHTVNISEMAQHNHIPVGVPQSADAGNPGHQPGPTKALGQAHAATGGGAVDVNLYGTGTPSKVLAANSIGNTGGSQSHENRQPFLVLNFCIALQGIFPSPT